MPRISKVSRLAQVNGIGVDRMGNAADAAHDPKILRLENLDTDIPPHGGWSLLVDAEACGISSELFSEKLFKKAKIATTPMVGWGNSAGKYVRFVFSNESKERLVGLGEKVRNALRV